ncbi:SDR family NAD(P)-dependent oxidoreductase [Baekduia soli]|uniref:SDR family NAD(P)-dependent oxidoreductase n=1 Tax=Baekduia soli TaxID=496014 RepID=UPI0016524767|nr:SDR family NAD(P)-dependent oxidoreductase [Baekduia soli]
MPQHPARLSGRRILITGASSGVGLEAARRFGAEGARLALLARGEEALHASVAEHGLDALVLPVDLTDRTAVEAAVAEAAQALGGLDVVVSNAASAVFGHVLEVHADDFDRTVAVTFTGAVNVLRAALPHLRASQGTIVATGSLMARVPLPTWSSYSAAKHALRGFLNSVAIEEREQGTGVRVAIVHPGPIDTPLFAQASSATMLQPRVAPDAYAAGVVAQALVEVAVRPRPEVVLGGETRLLDAMFSLTRPAAEAVLLLVDRWYRSGTEAAARPGSLWVAPARPQASGGIPARDSLLAPLQLGRRLLPARATPLRFAAHLALAARRLPALRRTLMRPVPERPAPAEGLAAGGGRRPERAGRVTV